MMKNKFLNIIGIIAVVVTAVIIFCIKRESGSMIDITNMDLSVRPGDDFYSYASAGWRKKNPLTGEYSRFGVFDKLRQENLERLHGIVKDTEDKKIATIYKQAMDAGKRNADGISPVGPEFSLIDQITNAEEFWGVLADSHRHGNAFWGDGVEEDIKDSEHYIYTIIQGGIGLPEREYYFDSDERSVMIREKYKKYMADLFKMFEIRGDPAAVYKIEEKLAKAHYKKEKLRDPGANYHKMTRAELAKKYPGWNWENYFELRGANPENINISQPEALAAALEIIKKEPLKNLRAYMKWHIANDAMNVLGDEQYELQFDFYARVLSGKTERRPRWKDAVALAEVALGEAVGKVYVEKYFPPAAKERMLGLVENLRRAYAARIKGLEWMSPETKQRALEKLAAVRVKIGYPDKWRDYSKLKISDEVSLYENLRAAEAFEDEFWMEKAGGPVDKSHWYMYPQTVNAYYNPPTNEICFPAGILQPPFFDMNAADAVNYGAIGSVIGHEMTHGFDDQGRRFDKDGNLKDWWSAEDAKDFEARAKVMEDFFNKIEVSPGLHANGKFTLGENLADYGGLMISFDAWKLASANASLPGGGKFTPEQMFFLGYAATEASNIRPEQVVASTKTDPHSLSKWRVNGILPHIDAWYEAFEVMPQDKMYLSPENRVRIW